MDERLLSLAHHLAEENFLAGSGPGGQNANKVATQVQLRINVLKLGLSTFVFKRLKSIAGKKLTASGYLLLSTKKHRSQEANRLEVRASLERILQEAHNIPKPRAKSRINRLKKAQRLKTKKIRSEVKLKRTKIRMPIGD